MAATISGRVPFPFPQSAGSFGLRDDLRGVKEKLMQIYDSTPKAVDAMSEEAVIDGFVEMQKTGGVYAGKFPSLDARHKRNSAKRRKRDKQIPPHKMTTMMTIMAARFQKMPKIKSHNKPRKPSTGKKIPEIQKSGKGPSTDNSVMQESVTNDSPQAEEVLTDNGDGSESSDDGEEVESATDEESDDGSMQQQDGPLHATAHGQHGALAV
jgi:hypothetical protein